MRTFQRGIQRFNEALASLASLLLLGLAGVTLSTVILRYLFGLGWVWFQDIGTYLHAAVFLLTIGFGFQRDSHVRVDIFFRKISERKQNWIDIAGHALFVLPVCYLVINTSLPYVQASWEVLEGSSDGNGLNGIFLLKTLIPLTAGIIGLSSLAQIFEKLSFLKGSSR